MRLSDAEVAALRTALSGVSYRHAFLFGSRTNEKAKGGDIDLMLYSDAPAFDTARRVSSRFAQVFDSRLDVLVVDPDHLSVEQSAFIATLTLEPLDDLLGL